MKFSKTKVGILPSQPNCEVFLYRPYPNKLGRQRLIVAYGGGKMFNQHEPVFVEAFVKTVVTYGFDVVTFDYRGHGPGQIMDDGTTSLATRVQDLLEVVGMVGNPDSRLVLMGHSMGGHVVAESLRYQKVRDNGVTSVILSVPAAYPNRAYDAPFGSQLWKASIQPPEDNKWQLSEAFDCVRCFESPKLLIRSSPDCPVIPDGVIRLYEKAIGPKGVNVSLSGPHQMFATPKRARLLAYEVVKFLEEQQ